jgi:ATP-dependent RNA helicase MSS116, mitochondrial
MVDWFLSFPFPFLNYRLVSQSYIITPQHLFLPTLVPLLHGDKSLHPSASKVMVFLPTARQVGFAAEVLTKVQGLEPVHEIHSRLTQPKRTRVASAFAQAKTGVLLSSDVTARGMDFPGYRPLLFPFLNLTFPHPALL